MRAWTPSARDTATPPLHNRVLLDWSGPAMGSNHQKFVVFCLGGELTAYVGGLDLSPSRYDTAPHDRLRLGTIATADCSFTRHPAENASSSFTPNCAPPPAAAPR
jgi:hypothetical protein